MSVDLDRVYEKLAEQSDSARIPTLQGVLDRAHQRRRRTIATAVSAVFVVATFVGARVFLAPSPSVDPAFPAPISFAGWGNVPDPVLRYGVPTRIGHVAADDKRAYTLWHEEFQAGGHLRLGAIDLRTDKPSWPALDLGKFGDTMAFAGVTPSAVLVVGEHDDGSDPDYVMFAVAPETGKLLWQKGFNFNGEEFEVYRDTLVHVSNGRTQGLDLLTGQPKWSVDDGVLSRGSLNWQSEPRPPWFLNFNQDHRLIQIYPDGKLRVRDSATGNVLSERSGVPQNGEGSRYVMEGSLYLQTDTGILRLPVEGSATPAPFFSPGAGEQVRSFTLCGLQLRCVLTSKGELVALQAESGQELWRRPASAQTSAIDVSATGIMVNVGEVGTAIYDFTGRDLTPKGFHDRLAIWLDGGNLLVITPRTTREPVPQPVSGYSLATGEETKLGDMAQIGVCATTAVKLICAGKEGFVVYRFAR